MKLAVLGLEHGATETEIKRAYRRLARRYHPDINPGDHTAEARFRQILEAYETLIDPQRRLRYDSGSPLPGGDQRKSGFEGFDFSGRAADHAATFGDLPFYSLVQLDHTIINAQDCALCKQGVPVEKVWV